LSTQYGLCKRSEEAAEQKEPILFAGGVARNLCMHHLLEEVIGKDILIPKNPQMVGLWVRHFCPGRQSIFQAIQWGIINKIFSYEIPYSK
jgi:hypothetical protein